MDFPHPDSPTTPSNLAVERCKRAVATILPVTGQPTDVGQATVADRSVLVYEFALTEPTADADTLVTFTDTATCEIVLAFQR